MRSSLKPDDRAGDGARPAEHCHADDIDVVYVAKLARLQLTDAEVSAFQPQLSKIVEYVRKVAELDVSGVEPTAHGIPVQNVMRRDEVKQGLLRETVMRNAPREYEGHFLVPKIVE